MSQLWLQVSIALPPPSERHSFDEYRRSRPMVVHTESGETLWARYDHSQGCWYDLEWHSCEVTEWLSRQR